MNLSLLKPVVSVLYFAIVLFFTFFAAFTIYILLKYGKSLMVAFLTSCAFLVIFITIVLTSYASLSNLKF